LLKKQERHFSNHCYRGTDQRKEERKSLLRAPGTAQPHVIGVGKIRGNGGGVHTWPLSGLRTQTGGLVSRGIFGEVTREKEGLSRAAKREQSSTIGLFLRRFSPTTKNAKMGQKSKLASSGWRGVLQSVHPLAEDCSRAGKAKKGGLATKIGGKREDTILEKGGRGNSRQFLITSTRGARGS